jgi:hypothetical protein
MWRANLAPDEQDKINFRESSGGQSHHRSSTNRRTSNFRASMGRFSMGDIFNFTENSEPSYKYESSPSPAAPPPQLLEQSKAASSPALPVPAVPPPAQRSQSFMGGLLGKVHW